jgi:hypothetical protein
VLIQTSKVNMPDADMKQLIKNLPAGILAKELSYPKNYDDLDVDGEVVLIELNHFFAHHCGLPAIIRALRSEKKYRFVPYIPLVSWEATHPTLEIVQGFYECMGIEEEILKATPSQEHFEKAKSVVIENLKYFQGEIWNLTDFEYDGIPMGVHLVETLLQQFKSAEFNQNINTTAYSVGLLARYLWWREWLPDNKVKYIIASHLCYEFAFPQLAGMARGIESYVWSQNTVYRGASFLPLPLGNDTWVEESLEQLMGLSSVAKSRYLELAHSDLKRRSEGERVGSLLNDPRFSKKAAKINSENFSFKTNGLPNLILYCHAFSDAPCTLPKATAGFLCSPLVTTRRILELCKSLQVNLYVKTHPSPFLQDDNALEAMLAQFENVVRVPSHLTPLEMKTLGADLVITGWGSIAYEAPYIGIPVIAYADVYPARGLGFIPVFDPKETNQLQVAIDRAMLTELESHKDAIAELYTAINIGGTINLTSSKLEELPREGDAGLYSLHAYKYWSETFEIEHHMTLVEAIVEFFARKKRLLSRLDLEN